MTLESLLMATQGTSKKKTHPGGKVWTNKKGDKPNLIQNCRMPGCSAGTLLGNTWLGTTGMCDISSWKMVGVKHRKPFRHSVIPSEVRCFRDILGGPNIFSRDIFWDGRREGCQKGCLLGRSGVNRSRWLSWFLCPVSWICFCWWFFTDELSNAIQHQEKTPFGRRKG